MIIINKAVLRAFLSLFLFINQIARRIAATAAAAEAVDEGRARTSRTPHALTAVSVFTRAMRAALFLTQSAFILHSSRVVGQPRTVRISTLRAAGTTSAYARIRATPLPPPPSLRTNTICICIAFQRCCCCCCGARHTEEEFR